MSNGRHEKDLESNHGADADPAQPNQAEQHAGRGAKSYGGDSDAGPGVTEEELERGLNRDQAEG